MGKVTLLLGLAGGAGAMYLLDPEHGPERRARLRDDVERLRKKLSDDEGHVDPRDILNRTRESVSDFRHRFSNGQREKVTSEIRDAATQLGSTGRWPAGTRVLAAGVGSGLALYGIRRTSLVGLGLTAAGLGLLVRAITNFELRKAGDGLDGDGISSRSRARDRRKQQLHAGMMEQPREQAGSRQAPARAQSEPARETDDAATAQDMRDRISEERAVFSDNPDNLPPE